MVFKSQRIKIIIAAKFAILILLAKVQLPAQAQLEQVETPNTSPALEPTIELDIQAMVASSSVITNSVADDVWELNAPQGMILLQLPINVKPGGKTGKIQSSALSVRGGQVLAWQVGKPPLPGSNRQVTDHRTVTSQSLPRSGRSSGFGPMGPLGGLVGPGLLSHGGGHRQTIKKNRENPKKDARQAIEIPPPTSWNTLPPRLARKIIVDPKGVVTWNLDRVFPGGIANAADQLYALKIDPKLLDRYNPGPSTKITRSQDESPTEFRNRKHKEKTEYRRQADAFRELRKRVVDLPTQFKQTDLPRLWAIVRAHAGKRAIVIDDHTQPPWNITLDQIQATGSLEGSQVSAKRRRRDDDATKVSEEQVQLISKMAELVRNEHPYNFRLAAYVLAKAGLPPPREESGQLYQLLETLLAGPDQETRMAVIVHLASITPPTNTSISLLRKARELMNPQMKLAALRSFLLADTTELEQLLVTINQDLLADTQGPPAGDVIRTLLQAVDDRPNLANLLASGIQFDPLSPDRCDQAIATVLDMASAEGYRNTNIASSELAATWIDQKLLGSNDGAVVRRTLESLHERLVATTATPNHTDSIAIALIPIGSADHSFYRLLEHEDSQLRTMAWQALRHFTFSTQQQSSRRRHQVDNTSSAYQKLADAALARQPTPKSIVPFLDNQGDLPQITAQLVRLVRKADKENSHAAARALLGSNRRINTSLEQLTLDQRYAFASTFYEAQTDKIPLVVGLMRHDHRHTPVIDWFAAQIAQGKLPDPAQWINAFRNDEELFELIGSSDEQLALAATASMVFSAGGDEGEVKRLLKQFRQSDQSSGAMQSIWNATRQRLNTNRLNDSVGTYTLVINTYGKARDEEGQDRQQPMMAPGVGLLPPPSNSFGPLGLPTGGAWELRQTTKKTGKPEQVLTLGPVQLQVDGNNVSFANHAVILSVRSEYMAICIENPSQLKSFPNEQLAQLPLEEATDPIDLLPADTGSWTGALQLPDSRIVELIMTPHPPD